MAAIAEIGARAFKKYNYEMRTKFPLILYAIEFQDSLQPDETNMACPDFY